MDLCKVIIVDKHTIEFVRPCHHVSPQFVSVYMPEITNLTIDIHISFHVSDCCIIRLMRSFDDLRGLSQVAVQLGHRAITLIEAGVYGASLKLNTSTWYAEL